MESKEELHQLILDRMSALGKIGPTAFVRVMEEDETLLTRYINATGLRAVDARIIGVDGEELTLLITLSEHVQRVGKICFLS